MPITLDDIDAILGFGLPAPDFAADPPAGPGSAPTGTPVGQLAADGAERTRARKRTDGADSKPAQRTKKRRMTTEEKVRKFLDGGTWNALLAPGESALSAEFTSRVATAAATMGLPDRVPDAPAPAVLSAADEGGGDAAPVRALSKPTYKSIDNLLCLAVAAPSHCNQQHIGRPQRSPQDKATATAGLALTSNASFCRTPEPLSAASTAAAAALPGPSPSVPALSSPARATAASRSPAVSIEMGMPKMWRSHSGTQLSCY
uniref:Uncharacterized protein n=1 Tax=Florenciella parvula TaxID=236787 RepID=A0A7S2FX31_9STRA|mmetsp:Transcript_25791/g.53319  ORF Transcript_25791/g.53319 Transcript_25791/m.53319 type:complete len:260 (+) Transcript_25791:294-1073(+)